MSMDFIPCYKFCDMKVQIEFEELKRLKEIEKNVLNKQYENQKPFYTTRKQDGTIHFFFWENKQDIERAYWERYGKLIDEM